jgi:DNA-3-methyladenine glycosylase I
VLRKRDALREVLAGFDPEAVVGLDVEPLLADPRIIRSLPKLRACVTNARATLALRAAGGLDGLIREYAELSSPAPRPEDGLPASTPSSVALAKRLKQAGFTFVGPVTVYSLLQACGLVNDHLAGCLVRDEVQAERVAALRC